MIEAPLLPPHVAGRRRSSTRPTAPLYHSCMRFVSLLLLALALSGCTLFVPKLQTPKLAIVDVEVLRANLLEQQLRVRMRVENPNDRSLPVQGLSYTIYLGGQQFATGVSDASFVVPALGTAEFNMDVTANAAGALFTILNQPRGQGIDYRMKGRVELSHGWLRSIPFQESGTFALR
jgi:LEA14-like dessication related protein